MAINFDEREPVEKEPVHLFTLNGDDYYIDPSGANVALVYLAKVEEVGEQVAQAWLLRYMIGDDAYQALMSYDGLTAEDLDDLIKVVVAEVLGKAGQMQVPLRRSSGSSARRKSGSGSKKPRG